MTKSIPNTAQEHCPNAPSVSVLMALYNGDEYLEFCLESVLQQSFRDFEFLILDDGSTDATADILARYAKRDARIRVISRPNRGLTPSLNELVTAAKGHYLARMDGDDICLPERFARQVAFLDAHPSVGVVGAYCEHIDEAGRPITVIQQPLDHATIDAQHCQGHSSIAHPAAMIRASKIRAVDGYDEQFTSAQDLDLWLRIGEICDLANVDEVLLQYRLTEGGISGQRGQKQHENARKACEDAWKRRGLTGITFKGGLWRPTESRSSRTDFWLMWAWQARGAGNQTTARHYFMKAVLHMPWSVAAWKGLLRGGLRSALEVKR